ncbi:hypothetical protein [Massilia rhizosphaerae]|uniref:hypothetical protein n=1 Tax=Massilia rhizosphaerae TaxID=2784389 RepID=UPI0018DCA55C|nr:hypothetical protein [Massilia rhizosphaerae]
MKATLRNAIFSASALILGSLSLVGCADMGKKPETSRELRGMGIVVVFDLAKGAHRKVGVNATTDAGNTMFSPATLTQTGGGDFSFGGGSNMSFPRWVRITWREGANEKAGLYWTTGNIVGDYKVAVLNRIPEEVFKYVAAARGRVIVLRFRIKDDGVLLAWDVQETVVHPSGGRGFVFSLHGGDFPCETSPYQPQPDCTSGRLEDAPWYNPLWTRE